MAAALKREGLVLFRSGRGRRRRRFPEVRTGLLFIAELLALVRPVSTSIPLPTQVKRVFFSNTTRPRPTRSGFDYPRYDARLHGGDEIHLETVHQSWLSVTREPSIMLQGRHLVLKASSGKFCGTRPGDVEGKFFCNYTEPPLTAWLKFVQAKRLGPKNSGVSSLRAFHMGSWCADWPTGWRCNGSSHEQWENFRVVSTGTENKIAILGARGFFCADGGHRGIVCNSRTMENSTSFEAVTDTPLKFAIVHSQDRNKAVTLVVQRKSFNSPEVALYCKDTGYYLAADGPRGEVSCSSREPWTFWAERVDWWDMETTTLRSPKTRLYLEAPDFALDVKVKTDNQDASGWALWKVILLAGYEHERPLIRGVNLGSWFLLEKWMVPDIFANLTGEGPFTDPCTAIDEYGLMEALGPTEGRRRMEQHWSTWITEDDIIWLANRGINAVRVPFGYWIAYALPPFVYGQMKYLKLLFKWCERHGVSILLDFHGLKGSQTSNPTSGNCGACGHSECGATEIKFLEEQRTNLMVIDKLTTEFSTSPAYLGFAVANEVASTADSRQVMEFYQEAYDIIRTKSEDALIVFFATFNPSSYPFPNFRNVAQDIHIYFGMGFGGPVSLDQQHNLHKAKRAVNGFHWPVIVGEWSLGGSGKPPVDPDSADMQSFLKQFAKMQLEAYETHCLGWFYWSYKTVYPNSTWNFRDMCEAGWIPGCKPTGLNYSTAEWWKASSCTFKYLEGSCNPGSAGQNGVASAVVGWLVTLLFMLGLAGGGAALWWFYPELAKSWLDMAKSWFDYACEAVPAALQWATFYATLAKTQAWSWSLARLQGWEPMGSSDQVAQSAPAANSRSEAARSLAQREGDDSKGGGEP